MSLLKRCLMGVIVISQLQWVQCSDNPIKHLIVLMMENRSFDHYMGWLKAINPDIDGLNGDEYNCVNPDDTTSECVTVSKNGYDEGPDDPLHDLDSITQQIYGYSKPMDETADAKMNGFVFNAHNANHNLSNVMSMFTIDDNSAPILNKLALEYAVFDRFYPDIPGPTDPNRGFAMSGTSNGIVTNFNGTLWNQQSYFDFLREHDVSWKAYYDTDPWAICYFEDTNTIPNSLNVHDIELFYEHAQSGNLPEFTWLQPRLHSHPIRGPPNWQHPDASIKEGEKLIQAVYESLISSPVWNSTALLITFDEHGGFYDHVSPPQDGVAHGSEVASDGFKFDRLGVRIPAVLISPWIKKGMVIHEPTDGPTETSQWTIGSGIATASRLFGITDFYTERHSWVATFENLFLQLTEPRSDKVSFEAMKPWTNDELARQRAKPLNDHLKIQMDFYCSQLKIDDCPQFDNQGDVSDWTIKVVPEYMKMIQTTPKCEDNDRPTC